MATRATYTAECNQLNGHYFAPQAAEGGWRLRWLEAKSLHGWLIAVGRVQLQGLLPTRAVRQIGGGETSRNNRVNRWVID